MTNISKEMTYFLSTIIQVKKKKNSSKLLRENNHQPRILYPDRLWLKLKSKINTFYTRNDKKVYIIKIY